MMTDGCDSDEYSDVVIVSDKVSPFQLRILIFYVPIMYVTKRSCSTF